MSKPATSTGPTWVPRPVPNDGSIERADIDGKNRRIIVPQGATHTPKQIQLDKENGKLYWCDREGMRVMRCNLDGSGLETLVETGRGDADRRDQTRWCVGITIDPKRGQIYWTQKGPDNGEKGRIFRAGLEIPAGETRRPSLRYRTVLRQVAGADRSRTRSQEQASLLDRSRRSTARQHGKPRIHRSKSPRRPRSCWRI